MKNALFAIFKSSSPLLFAMLGALLTEYTGTLAVFMEGAINLSAFLSAVFIISTGSTTIGFIASSLIVMIVIFASSVFVDKKKANPFLVGLAINMFSEGIASFYIGKFSNTHTIAFANYPLSSNILPSNAMYNTIIAIAMLIFLHIFLTYSAYGTRIKFVGEYSGVLQINGISTSKYKTMSWVFAAFFASCAGNVLVLKISAYSYGMSFGKGWLGILAVFLGMKKPLIALIVVFIFSISEYATNILQARASISPTILLSFPYVISFLMYIIHKIFSQKFKRMHKLID